MMLGVLTASSSVKYHWFARTCWLFCGVRCERAGDGALRRDAGRGGDVLDECVGGDGTAGGTSRFRDGDLDARSTAGAGGFGGRDGGW